MAGDLELQAAGNFDHVHRRRAARKVLYAKRTNADRAFVEELIEPCGSEWSEHSVAGSHEGYLEAGTLGRWGWGRSVLRYPDNA
jgi:hypothetical protein